MKVLFVWLDPTCSLRFQRSLFMRHALSRLYAGNRKMRTNWTDHTLVINRISWSRSHTHIRAVSGCNWLDCSEGKPAHARADPGPGRTLVNMNVRFTRIWGIGPEKEWRGGSHGLFSNNTATRRCLAKEIRWPDASTAGLLGERQQQRTRGPVEVHLLILRGRLSGGSPSLLLGFECYEPGGHNWALWTATPSSRRRWRRIGCRRWGRTTLRLEEISVVRRWIDGDCFRARKGINRSDGSVFIRGILMHDRHVAFAAVRNVNELSRWIPPQRIHSQKCAVLDRCHDLLSSIRIHNGRGAVAP